MRITTLFSEQVRSYTGRELRPHFLLTELGLKGSAVGAFIGPCHVSTQDLVDWEDRIQGDRIEARRMVHFLGEFFGVGLGEAVIFQRLFIAIIGEALRAQGVSRQGDDLFAKNRKLSVSIVTASPVSQLLHIGINIDPAGAPVPAIGLDELGVSIQEWVPQILSAFVQECEGMEWACAKVRPVM